MSVEEGPEDDLHIFDELYDDDELWRTDTPVENREGPPPNSLYMGTLWLLLAPQAQVGKQIE